MKNRKLDDVSLLNDLGYYVNQEQYGKYVSAHVNEEEVLSSSMYPIRVANCFLRPTCATQICTPSTMQTAKYEAILSPELEHASARAIRWYARLELGI
jgi:hypothetical protein